jgi:hypothetical protein
MVTPNPLPGTTSTTRARVTEVTHISHTGTGNKSKDALGIYPVGYDKF